MSHATGPDAVFAALADPTRRQVMALMAEGGPTTATRLAAALPITRQAVAKHLDVLEAGGLVHAARAGRETHWSLDPAPLDDATAWIAAVGARWDRRLGALSKALQRN